MDNFRQMQTFPGAAGVSVPVLYRYIWGRGMRGRQIFVYLPFVRIYVRMRKKLSLLLTLALCAVCTLRVQAGVPESETFIERGRSLFDYGRWSDARHEFLRARDVKGRSAISRRVIPVRSMPTTCGFRWGRSIAPRAI